MRSRGRPRLLIPRSNQARRQLLLMYISRDKERLFWAYCAQSQPRVLQAKLQLARHLRELADSPELGRPPQFKWGDKLTLFAQQNLDPQFTLIDIIETAGDYFKVANLLEEGITFAR